MLHRVFLQIYPRNASYCKGVVVSSAITWRPREGDWPSWSEIKRCINWTSVMSCISKWEPKKSKQFLNVHETRLLSTTS